jgi:hypothetical protein
MISSAVTEFGELLGMPNLGLDQDGSLVLQIEPSDTLCLVERGDRLHLSLSRERQYPGIPGAARLLDLLHFENTGGVAVRCRRTDFGRTTVLLQTLTGDGLRGVAILEAMDRLTKLHNTSEST